MHEPATGRMAQQAQAGAHLAARLLDAQPQDAVAVEKVVRAVFLTMHGDLTSRETSLLAEVEELGRTIAAAKAEIAALRVDDITDSHIPSATDELDAIVAHTATATNSILEVCEKLDSVAASMTGAQAEQLNDATTRIYEACSFQDITGQRISKVVLTLKAIEQKVAHIIATFSRAAASDHAASPITEVVAESLLNGPQLPLAAMDQSEIDKLLASFE